MVGGNGDIEAVLLLNWTKVTGTRVVDGTVELLVQERTEMPVRRQRRYVYGSMFMEEPY